jgi:hypothetical protein
MALGRAERGLEGAAKLFRYEAKPGPMSEEPTYDVGTHDGGQAYEDANVGPVEDDLGVARRRERERITRGQQKVSDGAVHGRQGSEQPHDARDEVEKLQKPQRVLPRAVQRARRSEEGTTSGAPHGDRSFGSLDGADARAPARCDDVNVVPFARERARFGFDEVAGGVSPRSWVRRRDEGDPQGVRRIHPLSLGHKSGVVDFLAKNELHIRIILTTVSF